MLTASCPNPTHRDSSPSWFIRDVPGEPYHAAHKCKGCGFSGGPVGLAAAVLGVDDKAAREWLRGMVQPVPLPMAVAVAPSEVPRTGEFALPECVRLDDPAEQWPAQIRDYLLRRVEPRQVARWGVGYVPASAAHRLAGRIVVPVRDELGRPRTYTARASSSHARLRYLEPRPEERPGRCLFGVQHWAGRRVLVVTEGVFDAFAVERCAPGAAVAALRGSEPQAPELMRVAAFELVVALTDPDRAGRRAMAMLEAACSGRFAKVALPSGKDPAALVEEEGGRVYLARRLELAGVA